MTRLTFLGTGGGRFVTLTQERSTGGIYLEDGARVHIDPGPGALSALRRSDIDPTRTDALLISHCHPDHYANGEILIEGMSFGRRGRSGILVASRSVTKGSGNIGPAISRYHQEKLCEVISVSRGDSFRIGALKGEATPSLHSDPAAVGFRLETSGGVVSYVSDTELRPEVIKSHMGARVLILATTRPLNARIPGHLSTEDASCFAQRIEPELCVLTHFGKRLLRDGADKQSQWIQRKSDVVTVAAFDGMVLDLEDEIQVSGPRGL